MGNGRWFAVIYLSETEVPEVHLDLPDSITSPYQRPLNSGRKEAVVFCFSGNTISAGARIYNKKGKKIDRIITLPMKFNPYPKFKHLIV